MTDAMEVLFSYAQDYLLHSILDREPDYADALRHADQQEQSLRSLLGKEEERLDALLDEQSSLDFHRERAMFRAGFQLAMELGRSSAL